MLCIFQLQGLMPFFTHTHFFYKLESPAVFSPKCWFFSSSYRNSTFIAQLCLDLSQHINCGVCSWFFSLTIRLRWHAHQDHIRIRIIYPRKCVFSAPFRLIHLSVVCYKLSSLSVKFSSFLSQLKSFSSSPPSKVVEVPGTDCFTSCCWKISLCLNNSVCLTHALSSLCCVSSHHECTSSWA